MEPIHVWAGETFLAEDTPAGLARPIARFANHIICYLIFDFEISRRAQAGVLVLDTELVIEIAGGALETVLEASQALLRALDALVLDPVIKVAGYAVTGVFPAL